MPSGLLLSNFGGAVSLRFPRAIRVKQSQPLHLVEALFSRKSSTGTQATSNRLGYSRNRSSRNTMAASGSVVGSGDLMVDALLSSCGNLSGFVKPGGVFFDDRSYRICRKARLSMRSGANGAQGCLVLDFGSSNNSNPLHSKRLSDCRAFSSTGYSDGVVPEVSEDASLRAEQLSSLALSPVPEKTPSHSILKLLSGACYMPHPEKVKTGGEDAHFICPDEQVIGVADGVGGWADVGVNAGEYARELMSNSVKAIKETPNGDVDPLGVLSKAHAATKAMGSSTACIVALKNQDLHAINLGDSGFIVVREGRVAFESPVQQHDFNFTYQLARDGSSGDPPSSGQLFKISVVPGDVIVAGSDGLFDNLYNKEVAAIVGDAVKEGLDPDATARKIAEIARVRALDRKYRTPFSMAAQQAGYAFYGGKLDDLTVVVSFVSTLASV